MKVHRIVQADYFNANIADPQAKTIYPHLMIIFLFHLLCYPSHILLSIMKADDEIKDDNPSYQAMELVIVHSHIAECG